MWRVPCAEFFVVYHIENRNLESFQNSSPCGYRDFWAHDQYLFGVLFCYLSGNVGFPNAGVAPIKSEPVTSQSGSHRPRVFFLVGEELQRSSA